MSAKLDEGFRRSGNRSGQFMQTRADLLVRCRGLELLTEGRGEFKSRVIPMWYRAGLWLSSRDGPL